MRIYPRHPIGIIILALILPTLVFIKMMSTRDGGTYAERFGQLSVMAQPVLFGDSLNIQAAAECLRLGQPIWANHGCGTTSLTGEKNQGAIDTPPYNYPPIWARTFALITDGLAQPLMTWGWLNTAAVIITMMVMAYRWNPLLYPAILASPVTLLCIERGNIDGFTFATLFLPIILMTKSLGAFGAGFSASLKVFPLPGFLALVMWHGRRKNWILIGCACAGLLLAYDTWTTITLYVGQATKGFDMAYGLRSWQYAKWLRDKPTTTLMLQAVYALATIVAMAHYSRSGALKRSAHNIRSLNQIDQLIIGISLATFLGTFFATSNWAYRFIFIAPAALALQKMPDFYPRALLWLFLISLWAPITGSGWRVFNLCAAATVIPASACFLAWLQVAWSDTPSTPIPDTVDRHSLGE